MPASEQRPLPPLPEARIVSYQVDGVMRRTELRTYDDADMHAYALAALRDSEAREIPAELFDGYSVYSAMTDGQKAFVSPEAVSAVLDATVRVIRASRALKELDRSSGAAADAGRTQG